MNSSIYLYIKELIEFKNFAVNELSYENVCIYVHISTCY